MGTIEKLETIEKLYGTYKLTKFWIIVTAISGCSVLVLPRAVSDLTLSTTPGHSLLLAIMIIFATFGVFLLPFSGWQYITRKRFFAWLQSQWSNLETGVTHPDGYTITLDTVLVRYQAVFSAVFATVSFTSRPYVVQHRSARVAQVSFTLLSLIFGWWFLGLDGVVETAKAVGDNVANSQTFTLRQLSSHQDEPQAADTLRTNHTSLFPGP